MDDLDIMEVAKGMEARFKAALAPLSEDSIQLSSDEAALTLGLLSALVDILDRDRRARE